MHKCDWSEFLDFFQTGHSTVVIHWYRDFYENVNHQNFLVQAVNQPTMRYDWSPITARPPSVPAVWVGLMSTQAGRGWCGVGVESVWGWVCQCELCLILPNLWHSRPCSPSLSPRGHRAGRFRDLSKGPVPNGTAVPALGFAPSSTPCQVTGYYKLQRTYVFICS